MVDVEVPVIVLSATEEANAVGLPLVQYKLRCPHCGAEQPWNLYSQVELPPILECPACEDGYATARMRNVFFQATAGRARPIGDRGAGRLQWHSG